MSYSAGNTYINMSCDIITPNNVNASNDWLLTAPSQFNTNITVNASSITLYAGSSYYLECSVFAWNPNRDGAITWQLHDGTQYIGQEAYHGFGQNSSRIYRLTRKVARALILSSDISGSLDISLRRKAYTGTGWSFSFTGSPLGVAQTGYPSITIMQLPT